MVAKKENATKKGPKGSLYDSPSRPYQPKRQRRLIKTDAVHPADLRRLEGRFFCDDCSHYSSTQNVCTIGYAPRHTRAEQLAHYELTGRMAFCRFLEID